MNLHPDWLVEPDDIAVYPRPIGRGSFGVIYRGVLPGTVDVAVKQLLDVQQMSAEHFNAFESEAALMTLISPHPNIVRVLACCSVPLSLVTVFVDSGNLRANLDDPAVEFTPYLKVAIMKDITAGLAHLHACNIIHRDLAARNVLLHANHDESTNDLLMPYVCKLSDFGMSRTGGEESQYTQQNIGPNQVDGH